MLRAVLVCMFLATTALFGLAYAADSAASGNLGHTTMLFLHQLLLVYWLGPDIAVFIWSRRAVVPELSVEQRVAAGKLMQTIDLVPRVCLSLFLTVAGILSDTYGIAHPWWQMAGIILLGPVWLTIVLLSWLNRGSDFGELVARMDIWLRIVLIIGMPISLFWSVATGRLADTPWIAGKLMLLTLIILLGLIMRLRFRAFFAGLDKLASEGQSEATDAAMALSLKRARPFGHAVWLLLIVAAVLGIIKPGDKQGAADATAAITVPAISSPLQ